MFKHHARHLLACTVLLPFLTAGCGGSNEFGVAPVSGRVTMDGKPLAEARVGFQPDFTAATGNQAGSDAFGVTDAEGRYTLELVLGGEGASVGRNRVSISTYHGVEDPATGQGKVLAPETVPEKYRGRTSTLTFDVPSAGTTEANFDLTSK
jgi:hypothetical protein